MNTKIFVCTHKEFDPPKDTLYEPLQVGSALHPPLGYLKDDSGDHISDLNPWFSELTGIYWIWKNRVDLDITGICHYRRFMVQEDPRTGIEHLFQTEQIEKILSEYDIITSSLLTLPFSYYEGFAVDHHIKDLMMTKQVLQEKYPEDAVVFEKLVREKHTYFGNICVASKKVYDAYCSWLFDILFEVRKRTDMTGYDGYTQRLFGFLSEFLLLVYTRARKLKVYESRIAIIGEKAETKEVKETLAHFFLQKDYQSAKQFFLKQKAKKPDILMEASDITGELRLCMQIIATCEFEQQLQGFYILERYTEYKQLIKHFRRLNLVVEHYCNREQNEEDLIFLKEKHEGVNIVSKESIQVAVRVVCSQNNQINLVLQRIEADIANS